MKQMSEHIHEFRKMIRVDSNSYIVGDRNVCLLHQLYLLFELRRIKNEDKYT